MSSFFTQFFNCFQILLSIRYFLFRTISSLPSSSTSSTPDPISTPIDASFNPIDEDERADAEFDNMLCDTQSNASDLSSVLSTGKQTPTSKKRKANETSEILRELLANRPNPSDFIPQKPVDDIQHFLDSIAVTMRKLSPLAIARLKMKIANIVGEEEIAWIEQNPVENIYLDSNAPNQMLNQMSEASLSTAPPAKPSGDQTDNDEMEQ